jgi:hypothetical protein
MQFEIPGSGCLTFQFLRTLAPEQKYSVNSGFIFQTVSAALDRHRAEMNATYGKLHVGHIFAQLRMDELQLA